MPAVSETPVIISKGTCYALFAYDGLSTNPRGAERRITANTERGRRRHKVRAPQYYFDYRPAPLRLVQEGGVFAVGLYQSSPSVEVMVYDFGAMTITYRFPPDGPFEHLLDLSELLYENEQLLGDQYLARVYRLVSQRFHLEAWDASILRKLQTLDSIYGKMSDRAGTRRMEYLEWIIIILIAVSIAVSFVPMGAH